MFWDFKGGLLYKLLFLSILLNFDVNRVLVVHVNRNIMVVVCKFMSVVYCSAALFC